MTKSKSNFLEQRGQTVCTLTIAQLYKIVRDRIEYLPKSYDPDAVAQQFCCEVEKGMGIYPNIPEKS